MLSEGKLKAKSNFGLSWGHFLFLLSIAVLLFKVSIHWYFPVSAIIGIPLCVKWKMKGMAVALHASPAIRRWLSKLGVG